MTPTSVRSVQIEALGDHLRAEQDVNQAFAKSAQNLLVAAAMPHAVAIDAADVVFWELRLDFRLQLFGPLTLVAQRLFAAGTATLWRLLFIAAVMAEQDIAGLVERHGQVAMLAHLDAPARRALNDSRIAAAVEQQNHLAAVAQSLMHGTLEPVADGPKPAPGRRLVTQVDQVHLRHRQSSTRLGRRNSV